MPELYTLLAQVQAQRQRLAEAAVARSRAALRGHLTRKLVETRNVALRGIRLRVTHRPGAVSALVGKVRELPGMAMACAREMAEAVKAKCVEWSSTEYRTLRELRRMGHPYSTRFGPGAAGMPDWIVNLHRGDFAGAWEVRTAPMPGGARAFVVNTNPVAVFMRGTTKMRLRPIQEAAFTQTTAERKNIWQRFKRRLKATPFGRPEGFPFEQLEGGA